MISIEEMIEDLKHMNPDAVAGDKMARYWSYLTWHFPIVEGAPDVPFDLTRVHPLNQLAVCKIYELVRDCDLVLCAWIIGSSINNNCTIKSDVDVMLFTSVWDDSMPDELIELANNIKKACRNGADIIRYEKLEPGCLMSYQKNTGLVIK